MSSYSETNTTTRESSGTWPVQFPAAGKFCSNRARGGEASVTDKVTNERLALGVWECLNKAACSRNFGGFWSNKMNPLMLAGPMAEVTSNDMGAWYCTTQTRSQLGRSINNFSSPLGDHNTTYLQHPKSAVGPFAEGAKAKKGHYWICGYTAYTMLPAHWSGICYVGIIRPLFFLLPEAKGPQLGVRIYDNLGNEGVTQHKWSVEVEIGGMQKWGNNEWPLKE